MKRILYCLVILTVSLSGCKRVDNNPTKGVTKFYDKMEQYASVGNAEDASKLMTEYLKAYDDQKREIFFLSLRNKLMAKSSDAVTEFVLTTNRKAYPIFQDYYSGLVASAMNEAMSQDKQVGSPADKALLFCAQLHSLYESRDMEGTKQAISDAYINLKDASRMARFEFFITFHHFLKNGGVQARNIIEVLQRDELNSPDVTAFMQLGVDSMVD